MIDGLSTQDIAQALFISPHTVHDHVKAIFAKIGVTRRQDLVAALAGNAHSHVDGVGRHPLDEARTSDRL